MLSLCITKGDSVYLGDDIKITVIGIKGRGKVQLGFDAPQDVKILREVHVAPEKRII